MRVGVFRCSQCPYQMWDPSPTDIDDHWRETHGDGVIRVVHDHGPGPDRNCPSCRAALDEYDRYGLTDDDLGADASEEGAA